VETKILLEPRTISEEKLPKSSTQKSPRKEKSEYEAPARPHASAPFTASAPASTTTTAVSSPVPLRPQSQAPEGPLEKPHVSFPMEKSEKSGKIKKSEKLEKRDTLSQSEKPKTGKMSASKKKKDIGKIINNEQDIEFIANNYFSIGIDSKMLMDFDNLRKQRPELFPHRVINFGWYGLIGLKSMLEKYKSLRHFTTLIADDKEIDIPKGVKALVCLNVPSYSGGTNPWKNSRNAVEIEEKTAQSICDGTIEIFAMKGAAHIGRNVAQVSRGGIRLCQCEEATLTITEVVAGQVDGEPYLFAPSIISLSCLTDKANMVFCTKNDPKQEKLKNLIGDANL